MEETDKSPSPAHSRSPSPATKSPAKKRKAVAGKTKAEAKTKKQKKQQISEQEVLLDSICHSTGSLDTAAEEWLVAYEEHGDRAIIALLGTVAYACGCTKFITREQFSNDDPAECLAEVVTAGSDEMQTFDFALTSKDKEKWGNFKKRYPAFWRKLIYRARRGPLFDDKMMDTLVSWVTTMVTTGLRPFRKTATLVAYSMMSGLAEVAAKLSQAVQTAAKRKIGKKKQGSENSDMKRLSHTQEHLRTMFDAAFALRYRDVADDIRLLSLEHMEQWLNAYPSFFMAENRMRYVAWLMSDPNPDIREQAIKTVCKAYEHDKKDKMNGFTGRFLQRIMGMTKDVKSSVAVEAMKTLTLIFKKEDSKMENSEVELTLGKIFDPIASVRHEAARFFKYFLRAQVPSGDKDTQTEDEKRDVNQKRLHLVLEFMDCYDFDEVGSYVVEAMWDVGVSFLYDWEMITTALINFDPDDEDNDDEEQHSSMKDKHMLGLVHAILLKLHDDLYVPADKEDVKAHYKKSSLTHQVKQDAITSMTEALLPKLRDLITRFQSNSAQVVWLLEIVHHLDFMVLSKKQFSKEFVNILDDIQDLFLKHDDEFVLRATAQLWHTLLWTTYPHKKEMETQFEDLQNALSSQLQNIQHTIRTEDVSPAQQKKYALLWRRIQHMWSAKDVSLRFWEPAITALTTSGGSCRWHLPPVVHSIVVAVLWKIKNEQAQEEDEDFAAATQNETLTQVHDKDDFQSIANAIDGLLRSDGLRDDVPVLAQLVAPMSTLLLTFSRSPVKGHRLDDVNKDTIDLLLDATDKVLAAPQPVNLSVEQRQGVDMRNSKMIAALCRVAPMEATTMGRLLRHYADAGTEIAEMLKRWRHDHWRVKAPGEAGLAEWEAIRFSFEEVLASDDSQQEKVLTDRLEELIKKLSREHNPHFIGYKKLLTGSVPRIIEQTFSWVFSDEDAHHHHDDDFIERSGLLALMVPYCGPQRLTKDEAKKLLKSLKKYTKKIDESELDVPRVASNLDACEVALSRAAGLYTAQPTTAAADQTTTADKTEKNSGKKRSATPNQDSTKKQKRSSSAGSSGGRKPKSPSASSTSSKSKAGVIAQLLGDDDEDDSLPQPGQWRGRKTRSRSGGSQGSP
eukprot:TRINITY_DN57706_c0_g1_i1.p1 TRINITY_DN57706_c0_g1~~TRINITY_DN57706_c0_g1_i1.p1  ORF type:complete len:1126 (+),score=136.63 TRINITY_DN57706_c0_g1_i1:29-3406(+)